MVFFFGFHFGHGCRHHCREAGWKAHRKISRTDAVGPGQQVSRHLGHGHHLRNFFLGNPCLLQSFRADGGRSGNRLQITQLPHEIRPLAGLPFQ